MNQIEELTEKFVKDHKIVFRSEQKKATFFADIKKSVQPAAGGKFRTGTGAHIPDLESYLLATLETGLYTNLRPSVKESYVSPFPIRSEGQRGAQKKLSETFLKKSLEYENIVFSQGMEKTILDLISTHFVPADGPDGIEFYKVTDSPVGSFFGKQGYSLEDVLNVSGVSHLVDGEATRIAKMQHKAQLRTMAQSMAEPGAKGPAIESLTADLEKFERRNLKTGKKIPYRSNEAIEKEYVKMRELNGDDRHSILTGSRSFMASLDDVTSVKMEAQKIKIVDETTEYNLND